MKNARKIYFSIIDALGNLIAVEENIHKEYLSLFQNAMLLVEKKFDTIHFYGFDAEDILTDTFGTIDDTSYDQLIIHTENHIFKFEVI